MHLLQLLCNYWGGIIFARRDDASHAVDQFARSPCSDRLRTHRPTVSAVHPAYLRALVIGPVYGGQARGADGHSLGCEHDNAGLSDYDDCARTIVSSGPHLHPEWAVMTLAAVAPVRVDMQW